MNALSDNIKYLKVQVRIEKAISLNHVLLKSRLIKFDLSVLEDDETVSEIIKPGLLQFRTLSTLSLQPFGDIRMSENFIQHLLPNKFRTLPLQNFQLIVDCGSKLSVESTFKQLLTLKIPNLRLNLRDTVGHVKSLDGITTRLLAQPALEYVQYGSVCKTGKSCIKCLLHAKLVVSLIVEICLSEKSRVTTFNMDYVVPKEFIFALLKKLYDSGVVCSSVNSKGDDFKKIIRIVRDRRPDFRVHLNVITGDEIMEIVRSGLI
ncbi:hypothetical protein HK098_008223 [Nowakowskiella sp. JEL0407]|nr:hypothetical protein HK098_008223 [Nowakowskiella sp. JEL0407]